MSIGRIAGIFYLLTFVTGMAALWFGATMVVANGVATAAYVVVTVLFYHLFRPVNATVSLIAALFSLAGCTVAALAAFHLTPIHVNSLAFFGVYCVLIGYLIFTSTFLPRTVGVLMAIGGLGWLTFASVPLARALVPYNMILGIFGEGVLTAWLLVRGVRPPASDPARVNA